MSYGFGYDPDSYVQDADIEMAQLQDAGNREARREKRMADAAPSCAKPE